MSDTTFHEATENVVALLEKYNPELRAEGFTDEQIDAEIARMRLEAQLGVRFSE